jgi:hypothetical protein
VLIIFFFSMTVLLITESGTEQIKLKGLVDAAEEFHKNRMAIMGQQEKLSLERGQFAIDYAVRFHDC